MPSQLCLLGIPIAALALAACSASGSSSGAGDSPRKPGDSPLGSGGNTSVTLGPEQGRDGGRPMRCDPSGQTCTCMNIASIGKVAAYGYNSDSTDAFQAWLNANSSAEVTMLTDRTELTAELLAKYDVIILQHLVDDRSQPGWKLSEQELSNVQAWVEAGGGLIALTGYHSDNSNEIIPSNQMLAFSGIQYNADDVLKDCRTTCPNNPNSPCCYCWGNSLPITQLLPGHPVTANLTWIPGFRGRTIAAPSEATVIATESEGSPPLAVGRDFGKGRVFVFGDEWVTYTSQWGGTGQENGNADQNNPCYDTSNQQFRTAANVFRVPQFWYNLIRWVQPGAQCFDIQDRGIIK